MTDRDFTIIIPAFNDLALLKRALESVLCQKGASFDITVADDSTTDDIERFMRQEHPSVGYLHNRPSLGAVANWNRGLEEATGRYVILMHHDEAMATDGYLTGIKSHLEQGADVVVSAIRVFEGDQERKRRFTPSVVRFFLRHPSMLFLANPIGPCACVAFRRELLQLFNTRLHWLVDVEWYYRMLRGHTFRYDPSLHILSIHGHEGQITGSMDTQEVFCKDRKELIRIYSHRPSVRFMLALQRYGIVWPKNIIRKIRGQ